MTTANIKKIGTIAFLFCLGMSYAQSYSNEFLAAQVESLRKDLRGPYKDIKWFCTNGSVRDAKDPCPEEIGPGVQHARYKDIVQKIGEKNHIYLGQILAYTEYKDLWDESFNHSRLKQYELGRYLYGVDNGWILEKGQYYRGSLQIEDEETAGKEFYKWLLANDNDINQKFYLIRESMKNVPHSGDSNLSQLMRSQSKIISDFEPRFMNARIKIHGRPEESDLDMVMTFKSKYQSNLSDSIVQQLDELIKTMHQFYTPVDGSSLMNKDTLLKGSLIGESLKKYTQETNFKNAKEVTVESAKLLLEIRRNILSLKKPLARIKLFNISLKLEEYIFKMAPDWTPSTVSELLEKIYYLGMANAGAGYIELWEWEEIDEILLPPSNLEMNLGELTHLLDTARGEVEWCASMVKAIYQETVTIYGAFEPKSYGFIDDKIRGSIMLPLGKSVAELGAFLAQEANLKNEVFDFQNTTSVRGLNPGYANGELVVVSNNPDDVEVNSNKIYIFQRPPSDLKPIAGIATVEEGNMVSHVQLLARNLGIPNAALSAENLLSLKKFEGQNVLYAVSNKGTVIMKLEKDMTAEEKALFEKKADRKEERIAVPIDKIRLDLKNVLNLREVDAASSGSLCGPKAANLGQLKKLFPDFVVEGLVIPFGIFKDHMDQNMPGKSTSYWGFLTDMFNEAEKMRSKDISESEVESFQLVKLEELRSAIKIMPLRAAFREELQNKFMSVLGEPLGKIPVFLRSDTNMEDLKDFTGAGLNLTLFNVSGVDNVWNGIKDVWASPYTERSFKWRQKYLTNPENVYPSILLIPGVDVDYSGVLITKGIRSGIDNDLTVAFSRGAGGAVDGQIAETYLIRMDETYDLIAPARESKYNSLPVSGGILKKSTSFEKRILSEEDIHKICLLAEQIRELLPKSSTSDYLGAYDVELGFKDGEIWLFQVRPFVENKKALSSNYLASISPEVDNKRNISLNTQL
jgi:Pyruvate phosphate dikinase, AMP/ATP-binding domain